MLWLLELVLIKEGVMALGRRVEERQGELWVATDRIAGGSAHVFYDRLNDVLDGSGFDRFAEELCEPFYATSGRPSIPPGTVFGALADKARLPDAVGRVL